eukprot:PhF_6_TR19793/c0_g1_i2/m.28861
MGLIRFYFYVLPRYFVKLVFHKLLIILFGLWIKFQLRNTPFNGLRLRRLVFHDWSKFTLFEYFAYADYFFGTDDSSTLVNTNSNSSTTKRVHTFHKAVIHHMERQDHHAEHWWDKGPIYPSTADLRREQSKTARRMTDEAVVEMIVDWHAAEVAYGGKIPRPHKNTKKDLDDSVLWKWPLTISDNTGLAPEADVVLHAVMAFLGYGEDMLGPQQFQKKVERWRDTFTSSPSSPDLLVRLRKLFDLEGGHLDSYACCLT